MRDFNDSPAARPDAKVFVFADSEASLAQSRTALSCVGIDQVETFPLSALRGRLERQAGGRTIIVEFSNPQDAVETAIACVERFADATDSSAIAAAPVPLIDRLEGAVSSDLVQILCEPDLADRVAALAIATNPVAPHFADSASELGSLRLKRLADEINRIARALTSLAVNGDDFAGREPIETDAMRDVQIGFAAEPLRIAMPPAGEIRAILRLRRLRENFFDRDLFADPAWDMLLDLLAARIEGDQVAVSSLCIAAAVPPTTALRWIKTMTDTDLVERHADPLDGRRVFIRLTDKAADALGRYFAAARRQGGMLI